MVERKAENGNVLFMILIAVVLFAALSYAVTNSSRGGSGDTSSEKSALGASGVLQLIETYDTAILRVKMAGCAVTQISTTFIGAAPSMSRAFVNANAPASGKCDVVKYAPASAKVPVAALDQTYKGRPSFGTVFTHKNFGVEGVDQNGNSGWLIVPYVTDKTCTEINKQLYNVAAIPASSTTVNNYQPWDGTLWAGPGWITCPSSPLGGMKCGGELGCFKIGTFQDYNENTNAATSGTNINAVYKRIINGN